MKPIAFIQNGRLVCEQKLFNESISAEYKVPEDRETRVYDFYTLALYDSLLSHKGTVQAGLLKPGWDEDTVADLQAYVHDGIETITRELKRDLLDATSLSVSAELRHAFDREENHDKVFQTVGEKLSPKLRKFYINLVHQKVMYKTIRKSPKWAKKEMQWREKGQTSNYTIAKNAFDKSKITYQELARIGEDVFMMDIWPSSYGGEPWKNICLGLAKLDSAKSIKEIIAAVDHILDLEHNTGIMLNKVKRFSKDGSFKWIKEALDFKFKASPWELAQKSSVPKAIVGRLNRLTGADTDFEKFQSKNALPDGQGNEPEEQSTNSKVFLNDGKAFADIIWKTISKSFVVYDGHIGLNLPKDGALLIEPGGLVFPVPSLSVGGSLGFIYEKFFSHVNLASFHKAFWILEDSHKIVEVLHQKQKDYVEISVLAGNPPRFTEKVYQVIESYIEDQKATDITVVFPQLNTKAEMLSSTKDAMGFIRYLGDELNNDHDSLPNDEEKKSVNKKEFLSHVVTVSGYKAISDYGLWSMMHGHNLYVVSSIQGPNHIRIFVKNEDLPFKNNKIIENVARLLTEKTWITEGKNIKITIEVADATPAMERKDIFKPISFDINYSEFKKELLLQKLNFYIPSLGDQALRGASRKGRERSPLLKNSVPKIVSNTVILDIDSRREFEEWASGKKFGPQTLYVNRVYGGYADNPSGSRKDKIIIAMRNKEFPLENTKPIEIIASILSKQEWTNNPTLRVQIQLEKVDVSGMMLSRKTSIVEAENMNDEKFLIRLIKSVFCK